METSDAVPSLVPSHAKVLLKGMILLFYPAPDINTKSLNLNRPAVNPCLSY